MFGYVVINKPELKFKEFDIYQAYYCGLCLTLKEKYGNISRLALNYDLNFISILLSGLYEPPTKHVESRCALHPLHRRIKYFNKYIDYAAKMTIVLTYFKCEDDWYDERKISRQSYKHLIKKAYREIKAEYPKKIAHIENCLLKINECEKNAVDNLDEISRYFGEVMGEICAYQEDEWYDELYELGFYLGKFIYFIDAYEDIETDLKKGTYNPFKKIYQSDKFEERCKEILEMMIAEATLAFERLPIITNATILRNILYSGVWTKYAYIKKKRMEGRS